MTEAKAFEGIRILDFTHYLAGPLCTFQMAMQGADVIKVEPREGEAMRQSPMSPEWSARQLGPGWMSVNANKRSLTLDLTRPEAIEIVHALAGQVDVVCENFRAGVMDKLGIGYSALSEINPKLIYCAVSGFGNTGPERRAASFDGKIQAMSGLMSLTGEPAGGPMRAGFAVADMTTGMTAAFALATALFQRSHTGRGQFVDVSMLESMLGFLAPQLAEFSISGIAHPQSGNLSTSRKVTADRFAAGDGFIVLAVLTDKQFVALFNALGLGSALSDPRWRDWNSRNQNGAALRVLIEEAMKEGDADTWERRLIDGDVPCAKVRNIAQIADHPQVQARGYLQPMQTPLGEVRLAGPAFRFAHGNGGIDRPIATPGAHSDEVLRQLGYDQARIEALRKQGVV